MSKIIVPETSCPELKAAITKWVQAKFGPNPEYDPAMQPLIDEFGLPWFRAAALVVDDENKILMMHEGRVNIKKIKDADYKQWLIETGRCDSEGWADGDGGWNIPAGRVAEGETFEQALRREVKEESGHEIEILGILYVRWNKDYAMPTYLTRKISGPDQYRTPESLGICKFSAEGIRALKDAGILRSPESVIGSLNVYDAYLRGEKQLNVINLW